MGSGRRSCGFAGADPAFDRVVDDPRLQIGVVERLQGEAEAVFGDEVLALAVQAPV